MTAPDAFKLILIPHKHVIQPISICYTKKQRFPQCSVPSSFQVVHTFFLSSVALNMEVSIFSGHCTITALVAGWTIMLESRKNSSHQTVTVGFFWFQ